MELKYLRVRIFGKLMGPFQRERRRRRMAVCADRMGLSKRMHVIDLGGLPGIWDTVETVHDITFLNLPGVKYFTDPTHHDAHYVEGDACDVEAFDDKAFDVTFSNSVVEHVGADEKMEQFAREVMRLSKGYWVQTPAKVFPIEAHCGMPFWWFYPQWLRDYFIGRWREKLPAWTDMVEGTRIVTREELEGLFPDAEIYVERFLGIPKSYAAFRPDPSVTDGA